MLKISVTDELFAVIFTNYPDTIFIFDMINLSTKVVI